MMKLVQRALRLRGALPLVGLMLMALAGSASAIWGD